MIRKIDVSDLPDPIVHAIESLVDAYRREAIGAIQPPQRLIGWLEGELELPDSFFDPLPDDILDAFEGKTADETAT